MNIIIKYNLLHITVVSNFTDQNGRFQFYRSKLLYPIWPIIKTIVSNLTDHRIQFYRFERNVYRSSILPRLNVTKRICIVIQFYRYKTFYRNFYQTFLSMSPNVFLLLSKTILPITKHFCRIQFYRSSILPILPIIVIVSNFTDHNFTDHQFYRS